MSKDHLSRTARNKIRYKEDGSDAAVARKYGIPAAVVREIRDTALPDHPVRQAAKERRGERKRLKKAIDSLGPPPLDAHKVVTGRIEPDQTPVLQVLGGAALPVPES